MLKIFLKTFVFCFALLSESQNAKPSPSAQPVDPCGTAKTQLEMNECSGGQYHKADAHLNAIYGKLMKLLREDKEKQNLENIEKIWIQYRDMHCEAAKSHYEGGSMAPMIYANCMTKTTNHRIEEIRDAYENPDISLE